MNSFGGGHRGASLKHRRISLAAAQTPPHRGYLALLRFAQRREKK